MASHWKSTPTYWCKFCSTYVRETAIERKNHESSIKHQNNIQRSLRELHKTKERDERDKQRAKDEVARLNDLVGGKKWGKKIESGGIIGAKVITARSDGGKVHDAAQRKAHAEQLAALGVQLPDELKKEVTGVGEWETVSTRVIDEGEAATGNSLADILKQESIKKEESKEDVVKGMHKRRVDDEDEDVLGDDEVRRKKAAWGSRMKAYPGKAVEEDDGQDLDALLSGLARKQQPATSEDGGEGQDAGNDIKEEPPEPVDAAEVAPDVKAEDGGDAEDGITAPPIPVFKKRKGKK